MSSGDMLMGPGGPVTRGPPRFLTSEYSEVLRAKKRLDHHKRRCGVKDQEVVGSFNTGYRVDHSIKIDSYNSSFACHQCKSKRAFAELIFCGHVDLRLPNAKTCRKKYCTKCLWRFYTEMPPPPKDVDETAWA